MTTSTLMSIVTNPNILAPLLSGVVAAIVALLGQYYFVWKNRKEERYRKFYGPLTYNLLRMKLLTENKKGLMEEIKQIPNIEIRNEEYPRHINPLVRQWNEHKNNIVQLIKEYPGYIRKEDIHLIGNILDGCIKRDVMEDGKNRYATPDRFDKLLNAVKNLQDKLLSQN